MKIDIFNIDEFVKVNKCPQIKNPVFFNFDKTPSADGLFSYELFGISDIKRKNIFGYIDLKGYYIHPLIFNMMNKRMGSMKDLIAGKKFAIIQDKKIVIVPEDYDGAETGIDFLYKNFERINWIDEVEEAEIDSIDKQTRLKFLKSVKKEEFFVSKWLVIPPYYRAESSENRTLGDSINKMYQELIMRTNSMGAGFGINMFGAETQFRIQNILIELFMETTRPVKGKNSLLRKSLMGKTIDYTASNVITAPANSNAETVDDMPAQFGYGSFPMATIISLFHPFFVAYLTDFLDKAIKEYLLYAFQEDIKSLDLTQFNSDRAEKILKEFIKSDEDKFKPIEFEYLSKSTGKKKFIRIEIIEYRSTSDKNAKKGIRRELTLADILFMIGKQITEDKHVYVTRYPISNFQNIYPTKIKLMSTSKVRKDFYLALENGASFNDILNYGQPYNDYPYIKFDNDPEKVPSTYYNFIDVFLSGNTPLAAIGGDYDGDMLYMRGVFTKEANAEAERLVYAKTNFLTANGSLSRGIAKLGKEAVVNLYELTKD